MYGVVRLLVQRARAILLLDPGLVQILALVAWAAGQHLHCVGSVLGPDPRGDRLRDARVEVAGVIVSSNEHAEREAMSTRVGR